MQVVENRHKLLVNYSDGNEAKEEDNEDETIDSSREIGYPKRNTISERIQETSWPATTGKKGTVAHNEAETLKSKLSRDDLIILISITCGKSKKPKWHDHLVGRD